jgi:hypothetical protein
VYTSSMRFAGAYLSVGLRIEHMRAQDFFHVRSVFLFGRKLN